jgi:hypothetical protein
MGGLCVKDGGILQETYLFFPGQVVWLGLSWRSAQVVALWHTFAAQVGPGMGVRRSRRRS